MELEIDYYYAEFSSAYLVPLQIKWHMLLRKAEFFEGLKLQLGTHFVRGISFMTNTHKLNIKEIMKAMNIAFHGKKNRVVKP